MNPEQLNLATISQHLATPEAARIYVESLLWPNGPRCTHCGSGDAHLMRSGANAKRPVRNGLYKCRACRGKFTVTMNTIFESSHIKLNVWLQAIFLMCSAKKAISAHQVHRSLGVTYKTAWFLCHRIRFAMSKGHIGSLLKGTVEIDETYVGGKPRHANNGEGKTVYAKKTAVVTLVERDGTKRSLVMERVNGQNVRQAVAKYVCSKAHIVTDESALYQPNMHVPGNQHHAVNHSKKEYRRMENGMNINTNTVESSFSLLKRGIVGAFHHVSAHHLHRYTTEFDFRWDYRKVTCGERTVAGIKQVVGRRLKYRRPDQSKEGRLLSA